MLSITIVLWMLSVGVANADSGVGLCVAGMGADLNDTGGPVYVGVTVADPTTASDPKTWSPQKWDNAAAFEAECCAEGGLPPDCFSHVTSGV